MMAGTYFHNPMLQVISVVRCRPVFPAARAEAGIRWMHPRSLRNSGLAEDTAGPVDGMCRAYRRLKLSPHKCCKQDLLQNERLPALSFRPFSPCQFDPTPRVNSPLPPGSIRPFPSGQFAPSPRVNSPLPPVSSRPAPAVISTCPRCHLDLPPLSSRPAPAVISTFPRCHLDRKGEISNGEKRDFSESLEMSKPTSLPSVPASNFVIFASGS